MATKEIDAFIKKGDLLVKGGRTHLTELTAGGMEPDAVDNFDADLRSLGGSSGTQRTKKGNLPTLTQAQNVKMTDAGKLIGKMKTTAHDIFPRGDARRKEFHINIALPVTVAGMQAELEYFAGVCSTYKPELKKRGIKDAQIARLTTLIAELKAADEVQETGKTTGVAKTRTRNVTFAQASTHFNTLMTTVKNVFEGDWETLAEFGIMPPPPRKPRKKKKGGKDVAAAK